MTDRVSVQSVLPEVSFDAAPSPLQAQFIEIKATHQATPEKSASDKTGKVGPGDRTSTGDKLFDEITAIKGKDLGQGFKDAQSAAAAFMTVPDKTEALQKGAPAFEAAIKTSDSNFISAIAKYSPDYNIARSDVGDAQVKAVMATDALKESFKKIPEDKQESVQQMMSLLQSDTSPALKASLRKELGQYPEFLKNYDKTEAAMQGVATSVQKMEHAAQPIMLAAREEAATRYIYAHAFELAGEKGKAYQMKQEGQGKLADAAEEYLGVPKPPKNILTA
ncbi:MAG: hypothetical protein KGS72_04000 [Cyanobacteria bacterium REEB67]|nr:hypothetical protein [Cyanobacteria bacterium REEB67]